MITLEQLVAVFNLTPRARLSLVHPPLVDAMAEFGIDTKPEVCKFLARCGEETYGLARFDENMNYSSQGLLKIFPKYFDADMAMAYARQPVRIASRVYANRMGNGDEASQDGWRHRGLGALQTTGKNNQFKCADVMGVPREDIGKFLISPAGAFRSAGFYWQHNDLDSWVAKDDFDGVNDIINIGRKTAKHGDAIGFDGASKYLHKLQTVLMGA